jgi:hypothetical protein
MSKNLKLGQGQRMYQNLTGGPDTIERLKALYKSGQRFEAISGLRILYMAAEAGVDAPLAALRQFVDLIRADLVAEQVAIRQSPVPDADRSSRRDCL